MILSKHSACYPRPRRSGLFSARLHQRCDGKREAEEAGEGIADAEIDVVGAWFAAGDEAEDAKCGGQK